MKILHVIPRIAPDQGGLRTGTLAICRAMQSAGMQTEIACLHEDERYDPPGIPVHRFEPGLRLLGTSIKMRNWLLDHAGDFDAIVAHVVWLNPAHYAAQASAKAGIPLLLASHGMLDPDALRHRRLRKVIRWHLGVRKLVRRSVLVFTSEEDRERSLSHVDLQGMPSVVVPNAVEEIKPGPEDAPPIVACLNRMHERKGVREFVAAMKLLNERGLQFQGVHAGHPEQADYAGEVMRAGEGIVDFRGRLPYSEIRELIRCSAVIVHPATGFENFGLVIAEGMMAGKAVAASPRALAAPQLGREGVIRMCEPTPESIAETIEPLLKEKTVRAELGKQAREYALQHFSFESVGERWRETLHDAIHSVPDDPV